MLAKYYWKRGLFEKNHWFNFRSRHLRRLLLLKLGPEDLIIFEASWQLLDDFESIAGWTKCLRKWQASWDMGYWSFLWETCYLFGDVFKLLMSINISTDPHQTRYRHLQNFYDAMISYSSFYHDWMYQSHSKTFQHIINGHLSSIMDLLLDSCKSF